VTIAIEVRRKLRLHAGDQIAFVEQEDGEFTVRVKKGDLMDLCGSLKWTVDNPPLPKGRRFLPNSESPSVGSCCWPHSSRARFTGDPGLAGP
jgi:bifunctional DNA-binding transcriptional regulator/antitoxin component of YhaV-PrlF toxin-antitoxin module